MVFSSTAPLVLLDGDVTVIAASASFCQAFDIDHSQAAGRTLFQLGKGAWDVPQLRSLFKATASGDAEIEAYEMELHRPGLPTLCLVINVHKLAYGNPNETRLLMAVADVTEARARTSKDRKLLRDQQHQNQELARNNELLVQEVRHRVANSLQIIASVMMQGAKRAQSEETRSHLRDAHHRVMSVAELQQQLAVSTLGTVNIGAYLTKLCATIAASMIADDNLSLTVTAEEATVDAGVSVSMGLIVTELVINSLKHAFPDGRGGAIKVDYQTEGGMWTLSVSDDGVGIPKVKPPVMAGLGTSIVQALAKQLGARVDVDDLHPGTKISIAHMPAARHAVVGDTPAPQKAV